MQYHDSAQVSPYAAQLADYKALTDTPTGCLYIDTACRPTQDGNGGKPVQRGGSGGQCHPECCYQRRLAPCTGASGRTLMDVSTKL